MPRVSQSHLDARRRQILDGALRCFTRRGFHTSSMQDVLTEIGLSAGAVYRYFSGKEEIIQAIAEEMLRDFAARMTAYVEQDDVPAFEEFVRQLPAVSAHVTGNPETAGMLLQVWSEAPRSPGLSAAAKSGFEEIVAVLTKVVVVYQDRGELSRDVAAEDCARVIISVMQGYVLQRAIFRTGEMESFQAAFAALVRTAPPLS
ncbi:TetR/AcrR family transcriptional regulator [Streptomyces sp. V4-01]|uniref:TetR/AcrR family transcriptional regulator n=1 Tax=Actinacidiphila polyblastidii TaxID=3110430 RepID=A0ABU7PLZ0_9ACTN|nr:TetR/AcrR family transcriptional regulator [Streptomyces sp. V4-01]